MKVLVAPLDWGLGHATRCVPIIETLLKNGVEVVLGTCGSLKHFYSDAFPSLQQVDLPSYGIVYPTHGFQMPAWILSQLPRLHSIIEEEQRCVENLVSTLGISAVISDNRFGAYSKRVPSVYITHQLRIAFPFASRFLETIGVHFHAAKMLKFSEIWIPDLEEFPGFAGRLSHQKLHRPCHYIGPLSRFMNIAGNEKIPSPEKRYRFLGMVSGVEPMRTKLETLLRETFAKIPGEHALLLGKPSSSIEKERCGNVTLFSHLSKEKFQNLVQESEYFISRPGYSTIMDQSFLGSNCLFIPTPGQTEQIYLGKILAKFKYARVVEERNLNAEYLASAFEGPIYRLPKSNLGLLENTISAFMEQLK